MVERIQLVGPSNLLNNMVQVFANTGNTLLPSNLRIPFGARHESAALCKWGVLNPKKKKSETTTHGRGARGALLHKKFLQGICIHTHPCNMGTHTVGVTLLHPPLDTTRLAIVINGVQGVGQILKHNKKDLASWGPKRGRKCYVTPAFCGIPKQEGTKS